jgi:hypothetical protein
VPGQVAGTWTETVRNCGDSVPPCTAPSTIGLGTIQIAIPSDFRPATSVIATSPSGQPTRNWTASYDAGSGTIQAYSTTGADKLQSGESIKISFDSTPSSCTPGARTFTTGAWGSTPSHDMSQLFSIVGSQPSVTISGCALEAGETATDPATGETLTPDGFEGTVIVSFGGALSCADRPLGDQWSSYHLATQFNITPGDDYVPGAVKTLRITFNQSISGGDSSWYLLCYESPTPFTDRSGQVDTRGILPACYNPASGETRPEPCVAEQYLTTGPGSPPWSVGANKIVIFLRLRPGDPQGR